MRTWPTLLSAIVLVGPSVAPPAAAENALVCNVAALTAAQHERHQKLGRLLRSAVVQKAELENGYDFVMDLGRLPADTAGEAFCVVEVAEFPERLGARRVGRDAARDQFLGARVEVKTQLGLDAFVNRTRRRGPAGRTGVVGHGLRTSNTADA